MRLVPYLHAAFVRYHREGLPPFRPLVMDHPDDVQCWPVDDQFLVGDGLLVAPVVAGQSKRGVYLPEGEWFDHWSGRRYTGRQRIEIEVPLDEIPLFVRSGTLLPVATPTLHTDDPRSGELTVLAYGTADAALTLYEEEGEHAPKLTEVRLTWEARRGQGALRRTGPARAPHYRVTEWKAVK
jgi:alpha-D-xyloside xylohydrolase